MTRITKSVSRKTGLAPGTLIHIGDKKTSMALINLILYDQIEYSEIQISHLEKAFKLREKGKFYWLDIDGIHDPDIVAAVGEFFNLHPLLQEDILNTEQRPKFDEYDNCLFLVVKSLSYVETKMVTEQISIILGEDFLITFQERASDLFEPIRKRLQNSQGRMRKMGIDYLAYALMDTIVDGYFSVLETLDEKIETTEDEITLNTTPTTLQNLHLLKREVLYLRKLAWPLRDALAALERNESVFIKEPIQIYLKDVHDHIIRVIDTVEAFHEILSDMLDIYLSSISNKMNEVMKVLTVISTIFIPLTFIVGVYGMNFKYMPELGWRGGYFGVLVIMLIIGLVMVLYFKKKKWL